jgi:predicted ABC-type ATPase
MPWFWIIAGPNGAGKTTLVSAGVVRKIAGIELTSLNADVRTAAILANAPDTPDAILRAAIEIDAKVVECIDDGRDFLVETVLSSDKYLDDVRRAIVLGYRIGVIYVALETPEDAVHRVRLRRIRGGHDVPVDRIVERWSRSIRMLGRLAPMADRLYVFNNTDPQGPVLVARKDRGQITLVSANHIPAIDAVLLAVGAVTR